MVTPNSPMELLSALTLAIEVPTLVRNMAPLTVVVALWVLLSLGLKSRDKN